MDALISAAARALAAGDPLAALKQVALRDDPSALALRGIAMAQLGELQRARELLRRAARGFGTREPLARARCMVAESEVALALRDLGASPRALGAVADTLQSRGDARNAVLARLVSARRALMLGRLAACESALAGLQGMALPATLSAVAELARTELALRRLQVGVAHAALARARDAAGRAGVPALQAEVAEAGAALARPAARLQAAGVDRPVGLDEIAALLDADTLVVDACCHGVVLHGERRSLARRPVLFTLLRSLATAWPAEMPRESLIAAAFRIHRPDETDRVRLRVEIGRLRRLVAPLATIVPGAHGFALHAAADGPVVVLAPPIAGEQGALVALLSDGAGWSTSALALALDASQRTVQRALSELEAEGRVRSIGRARAQRWLAPPLVDFTTILLLPSALALD